MREGLLQKRPKVLHKVAPLILLPYSTLCLWGCGPSNLQTIDVIPEESMVAALEAKQEEELMRPAPDAVPAEVDSDASQPTNPNPLQEMGFAQNQIPNQKSQMGAKGMGQPATATATATATAPAPAAATAPMPENVELPDGNSPLHMAITHQDKQGLNILLGMGYDVNGQNNFGESPAILAAKNNHYELLLILLEFGANPNLQDMSGNSVRSLVTAQPVEPSSPQFIWRDRVKTVLLGQ